MAKARARTTTRKVKDRWKAKNWYQILSPSLFNNVPVAETLAETPDSLIGRFTEVSLQDLTNEFRKSHIKLLFTVDKVEQNTAHTQLKGSVLTSDYLRRMIRRRKSRVDGVFEVQTRDGALLRVKPFAIAEKRNQSSQKKLIRNTMNEIISKEGKTKTLNAFIRDCLEGKIGSEIYKHYFERHPGVRAYIGNVIDGARKKGYVETLFGRKRLIPELNSPNRNIQQQGDQVFCCCVPRQRDSVQSRSANSRIE